MRDSAIDAPIDLGSPTLPEPSLEGALEHHAAGLGALITVS